MPRDLPPSAGLTERQVRLLNFIIGDYIATATPVASETLSRRHDLGVSPATIRHDMVVLEEEGYVLQPHTSAGRIPSDKGYRFYVDQLGDRIALPLHEQVRMRHQFYQVEGEPEQWTRLAGGILSSLVQAVAFITPPRAWPARLKHLDLISIQEYLALLLLLLSEAHLQRHLLGLPRPATQAELTAVAQRLTALFRGQTGAEMSASTEELSPLESHVHQTVVRVLESEASPSWDDIYLEGRSALFRQPEFTLALGSGRSVRVLEILEEKAAFSSLLAYTLKRDAEVKVVIGAENELEDLQDYTLILGHYGFPGQVFGALGILGPTRLPYPRAIASVRFLSSVLSTLWGTVLG